MSHTISVVDLVSNVQSDAPQGLTPVYQSDHGKAA